jgi:preprotein translocase subunit SecG
MLLNILLSILVIDAVALTGVILLQRSEGGALGMGGGGGNFLSARGAGDLLTRTTAVLATLMFVISMAITLITGHSRGAASVADRINAANLPASAAPAPQQQQPGASGAAPAAPPLPGAAPASPPPLPTEAPRPVVKAPVRPAAPAGRTAAVRPAPADSLARIQIPRQGASAPRVDPAAPASSTPQQ